MNKLALPFLAAVFFSTLALADVPNQRIATTFPSGDGHITFYNYHTGEVLDVNYRNGSKYNTAGLEKINRLFRCRSDHEMRDIDILLIELLDHLQEHFGADEIELISGYRSPVLNRALKKAGVNVAEESMHLEGKAADIHLDEVTEEALANYARTLGVGGVGYYPAMDFVHVDTSDVRKWDLPDRPGRLMSAFRKSDIWQIITDKDVYGPKQPVKIETTNISRMTSQGAPQMSLQIFRRGEWKDLRAIDACKDELRAGKACKENLSFTEKDPFGKFRIVIKGPADLPDVEARSNEFYRKKS